MERTCTNRDCGSTETVAGFIFAGIPIYYCKKHVSTGLDFLKHFLSKFESALAPKQFSEEEYAFYDVLLTIKSKLDNFNKKDYRRASKGNSELTTEVECASD